MGFRKQYGKYIVPGQHHIIADLTDLKYPHKTTAYRSYTQPKTKPANTTQTRLRKKIEQRKKCAETNSQKKTASDAIKSDTKLDNMDQSKKIKPVVEKQVNQASTNLGELDKGKNPQQALVPFKVKETTADIGKTKNTGNTLLLYYMVYNYWQ